MSEIIKITEARVKFVGIFDMSDYYRLLYDIIKSMGYIIVESKYSHKTIPSGDRIELEWNCFKKVDDYSQFHIFARTLVTDLQKVQVKVDEATSTKHRGDIELELVCKIITDYENRWETNPITKFLKGVYDIYFYKSTFDTWVTKITSEIHTVENEMKAFFRMEKFM
jgi:hypothetical protein